MPKLIWLRALSLAAATAACAHVQPRDSTVPLRILTYNIRSGNGSLANIAATIRSLAPDIVGLQEVDVHWAERSAFEDQAAALGRILGMHVRFAPIYTLTGPDSAKPSRQFGVALLSRYPIVGWTNRNLTRLSTQAQNPSPALAPGLLDATIETPGTVVRVLNTHLDYRADPGVRKQQVAEMLAYLGNAARPTLVLGDLNASPDAPELQPLFERLRDTWQKAVDPGFTYPAENPVKRIDYVLASSHFLVRSALVAITRASDHRPVVVELLLR